MSLLASGLALLVLGSCSLIETPRDPVAAKRKLKELGITFDASSFVSNAKNGNKKVVDPRDIPLEYILQHKWCPNCRRRGCWRALSSDEAKWDC